jgi:hypothetical protein
MRTSRAELATQYGRRVLALTLASSAALRDKRIDARAIQLLAP